MTNNPINPLDWLQSAQDWFRKTERSSGFRSYLIFLFIHCGFAIVALSLFSDIEGLKTLIVNSLYVSFIGFVFLFAIKSFQEPDFCRSEKHIENVKKLELMEQKGDTTPKAVLPGEVEVISNPDVKQLPEGNGGGVMKKVYLLAFSDDLGTREQVKECVDSMPSVLTWRYDMTNAFYILSIESADALSSELRERIKNNGRFIITELTDNKQGWLTSGSWYLMRHKQLDPDE